MTYKTFALSAPACVPPTKKHVWGHFVRFCKKQIKTKQNKASATRVELWELRGERAPTRTAPSPSGTKSKERHGQAVENLWKKS